MSSTESDLTQWYTGIRPAYERLGESVVSITTQLLRTRRVEYLAITSRAKDVRSFSEKIQRKRYADPQREMMDLCGVRIVTYLDSDVARVVELLQATFAVDDNNSVDKSTVLQTDRVGYRSVHLVCTLGEEREGLAEYKGLEGLKFEVQVRTALQHAWAQVEHDRNYKFGGILPAELQRRLHLAAGTLELVDQEFDRIAVEVESYARRVAQEATSGTPDAEINTTSLRSLVEQRSREHLSGEFRALSNSRLQSELVAELRRFGLTTLADVDALLSPEYFEARNAHPEPEWAATNELGLLRDAMMFADLDKYLAEAHDRSWSGLDDTAVAMLASKYGREHVESVLADHDIDVIPSDTYFARGG